MAAEKTVAETANSPDVTVQSFQEQHTMNNSAAPTEDEHEDTNENNHKNYNSHDNSDDDEDSEDEHRRALDDHYQQSNSALEQENLDDDEDILSQVSTVFMRLNLLLNIFARRQHGRQHHRIMAAMKSMSPGLKMN